MTQADKQSYPPLSHQQLLSLLPDMEEGIQIWDHLGNLIYANAITKTHFDNTEIADIYSYTDLLKSCCNENGLSLSQKQSPIAKVLENKKPYLNCCLQILAHHQICNALEKNEKEHSIIESLTNDVPENEPENEQKWLKINAYPNFSESSQFMGVVTTSHDISIYVNKAKQLAKDAHYDVLTGLPNRILLPERMRISLAYSDRSKEPVAICMMDLDGFKFVNDTYGHETGDELLKMVAQRLKKCLREEDTAIRLGGDEFVLLICGLQNDRDYEVALKRIIEAIAQPYYINGHTAKVTASIGVTLYPSDSAIAEQLLRHADQAMYKAKEQGKNCYLMFDATRESRLRENYNIIRSMERALANNQFQLYYQPKIDCKKGKVIGLEALIRWIHPILGVRAPGEFLPIIEKDDLIIEIGNWVINSVLEQMQKWKEQGLKLNVSLNIAARQFLHGDFSAYLDKLAQIYPADIISCLEIEILESAALEDMHAVSAIISENKNKGFVFSLDDFGTGYSSLIHLKHLDVHTLKVDKSFIKDMVSDPGDLMLIKGIVGLAEPFRLNIVAEGVETVEQVLILLELGCDVMQGYYFSRPMPVEKVADWIHHFKVDPLWKLSQDYFPKQSDFDLLLLEVKHNYWLEEYKSLYELDDLKSCIEFSQKPCFLSKWFTDVGRSKYAHCDSFMLIEKLHLDFHLQIKAINALKYAKHSRQQQQLISHLDQISQTLTTEIYNFRMHIMQNSSK